MSGSVHIDSKDRRRRRAPSLFDTDWLVLRELSAAVETFAEKTIFPHDRVVDFGCGSQPYRAVCESRGANYRGADFGGDCDLVIESDGKIVAPDNSATIVTSFQVLEHVRDLGMYFAEADRILVDEGELILSTHGTWLFHPHPEDHRRWTRTGLIGDLKVHGWEVTECVSLVGPLAFTTLIRLTGFSFVLRKIPLVGGLFAASLAFVMNIRAIIEDAVTPHSVRADNACVYLVRARKIAKP